MRHLNLAAILLLASATTACVDDSDRGRPDDVQQDWRTGGKGDGETCDFDTMPAATYYSLFDYKATVSETTGDTWYRAGLTWDVHGILDNGDEAVLKVYFDPGDRVIAEYGEDHRLTASSYEVRNQSFIVTHRSIDPSTRTITLAGIGSGTPLTLRNASGGCEPAMVFKHTSDLRSPGLSGDDATILAGSTTAFVIDPDHLDQVPSAVARRYFEEDVASGKIKVVHF